MKAMSAPHHRADRTKTARIDRSAATGAGAGQILARVSVCGVCRTDLHVIEGELPRQVLPIIPGHQIIGRVEQVGADVARLKVGDRVGIPWLHQTCGVCEYCREGKENLCGTPFTGWLVNGGYAEYAVAPADFVYPIPEAFSDEEAAPLLCAGIIGFRSLRLSIGASPSPGKRLGIYGFGAAAHRDPGRAPLGRGRLRLHPRRTASAARPRPRGGVGWRQR